MWILSLTGPTDREEFWLVPTIARTWFSTSTTSPEKPWNLEEPQKHPSWDFFLIGRHVFISFDRRRCRASSRIQKVARKSRNVYLLHTSCFFFSPHLGAPMQMTSCRCICLAPPERQSRRHKRGVAPTSDVTATRRLNVTDRRFFQSPSKQSVFFLFLPSLLFKCFLQTSSQMDLWIKSNRSGKLTIWRVAALFICGVFLGGG